MSSSSSATPEPKAAPPGLNKPGLKRKAANKAVGKRPKRKKTKKERPTSDRMRQELARFRRLDKVPTWQERQKENDEREKENVIPQNVTPPPPPPDVQRPQERRVEWLCAMMQIYGHSVCASMDSQNNVDVGRRRSPRTNWPEGTNLWVQVDGSFMRAEVVRNHDLGWMVWLQSEFEKEPTERTETLITYEDAKKKRATKMPVEDLSIIAAAKATLDLARAKDEKDYAVSRNRAALHELAVKAEKAVAEKFPARALEDLALTEEGPSAAEKNAVINFVYNCAPGEKPNLTKRDGKQKRHADLISRIESRHGKGGAEKMAFDTVRNWAKRRADGLKQIPRSQNRGGRKRTVSDQGLLAILKHAALSHLARATDVKCGGKGCELEELLLKVAQDEAQENGTRVPAYLEPSTLKRLKKTLYECGKKISKTQHQTIRRREAQADLRNVISLAVALEHEMFDPDEESFVSPFLTFNMDATQVVHTIDRGGSLEFTFIPYGAKHSQKNQRKYGDSRTKGRKGSAPNPQRYKLFVCANAGGEYLPPCLVVKLKSKEWGKGSNQPWIEKVPGFKRKGGGEDDGYVIFTKNGERQDLVAQLYNREVLQPGLKKIREEHFGAESKRKALFMFDGEKEQLDEFKATAEDFYEKENITLLKLPAACTGFLQPLDVSTGFRAMKKIFRCNTKMGFTDQRLKDHIHLLRDEIKNRGGEGMESGRFRVFNSVMKQLPNVMAQAFTHNAIINAFIEIGITREEDEYEMKGPNKELILQRGTALLTPHEMSSLMMDWEYLSLRYEKNNGIIYETEYNACGIRPGALTNTKLNLNELVVRRGRCQRFPNKLDEKRRAALAEREKKFQDEEKKRKEAEKRKKRDKVQELKDQLKTVKTEKNACKRKLTEAERKLKEAERKIKQLEQRLNDQAALIA